MGIMSMRRILTRPFSAVQKKYQKNIILLLRCVPTHGILESVETTEGSKAMPKEDDRHIGKRENIWFPYAEHRDMLKAMEELKETNKSNFIRSAVRSFIKAHNEQKGK